MIETERNISGTIGNGKEISLSVRLEVGDISSEDEQLEAVRELEMMTRMLFAEFAATIRTGKANEWHAPSGNEIYRHFGIDETSEISVIDSKKLALGFIALSLVVIDSPMQFIIDFDPNFPWAVLRKKDISSP